jgi:hypothetical protein
MDGNRPTANPRPLPVCAQHSSVSLFRPDKRAFTQYRVRAAVRRIS